MGLQIPGESFYWVSRSHRFRVPWLLRHVEPPWAALPAPSNTNPPSFLLSSNPPKRIHLESASQSWHLSVNPKSWQTLSYHQFSSVVQLCPTLCDPMYCSMPGFAVHHQLPELAQTHVHQVSDAIQPSHPLMSPSPPTFNLSQQQDLFQSVSSSY